MSKNDPLVGISNMWHRSNLTHNHRMSIILRIKTGLKPSRQLIAVNRPHGLNSSSLSVTIKYITYAELQKKKYKHCIK